MNLRKLERYSPVNLLGTSPRLICIYIYIKKKEKKRIYRTAVSQRLRNTAPGDLAYTGRLLEWELPKLFGQYEDFIYLFFVLGSKFVLGYYPSHCVT